MPLIPSDTVHMIPKLPPAGPEAVPQPAGWLVEAGDGQTPAVVMHDQFFSDRTENLPQTNEIQPMRPVDQQGLVGFALSLIGWRVYPTGKIIVHLEDRPAWWQWIVDSIGPRNAGRFVTHGDGFMDTNDDSVPLTTAEYPDMRNPNPAKDLKLMVAATGGMLVNIEGSIAQSGTWYELIETMDYFNPPVQVNGEWQYDGVAMNWESHPHLFTSRVNRVTTREITWQTRNGINAATDGWEEGGPGSKGDEHWPTPANTRAALQRSLVFRYPELPCMCTIHAESLVVDGQLKTRSGGMTVVLDAYIFRGSQTYGRAVDGKWYLLEEMLVRSDSVRRPANGFDWRCYASLDNKYPYMPYRAWRVPVCGWTRGKEI